MDIKRQKTFDLRIFGLPLFSFHNAQVWQTASTALKTRRPETRLADETLAQKDRKSLFIINSMMLFKCFKQLTETENENLHAVTGSAIGRIRSLEQIVPVALSIQNVGAAAAENQSLAHELLVLHEFGLRPLAYFHSHPGNGITATHPSSTDKCTQSLMEQSGSEIIGGIFSRDGFVRFYANRREPEVRVLGKRVMRIKKNVYHLEIEEDL